MSPSQKLSERSWVEAFLSALRTPAAAGGRCLWGLIGSVLLLTAAAGCGISRPEDWSKLGDIEKAKKIKEFRGRTQDELKKVVLSEGRDMKALEKVVEYTRITTEIAPATCHLCFREYAFALSLLGHAHRENADELVKDADDAESDEEAEELREKAAEERRSMEEIFKKSNQVYRTYFRNPGGFQIDPYDYERVMRHFELMGDFEGALDALNRFVFAYGKMDDSLKDKVERLKQHYKREIQRQREQGYKSGKRPSGARPEGSEDPAPPRPGPRPGRGSSGSSRRSEE
ncbi:MAG: hypothetical protein HY717_19680 [Planctomycetes bacterium]|nr:hypothetical protein [Planctomycetota bacterium]